MKKVLCLLFAASLSNIAYAADKNANNEDAQFDQMFNNVDSNHDGKISKAEAQLKAPAMGEAFERIDANRDGYLSKQEIKTFSAILLKSRNEFNRRLNEADKDKNGKLSKEESKTIPMLYKNFDAMDSNHDGQLTGQEIAAYLRAQLEAQSKNAQSAVK